MIDYKILIILLFALLLFLGEAGAQTVCPQKVKVSDIKTSVDKGGFRVEIQAPGAFDVQVIDMGSEDPRLLQVFSGFEAIERSFVDLAKSRYRIVIEYRNEDKFLCKKKSYNVDLTDSSSW